MSILNDRRYTSDLPLEPWAHARVWLTCGGALLFLHGQTQDPEWVETFFIPWGLAATGWLTWLTSWVPLAISEFVVILLGGWVILRFLEGIAEVGAGRRRFLNALLGGTLFAGDLAFFLAAWFYVSWGAAYQRPPIAERWDLDVHDASANQGEALLSATLAATERTNHAYYRLHGSGDAGKVTVPRAGLDVDAAMERGFAALEPKEGEAFSAPRGAVKVPYISPFLSYLQVAGIFVPFTGEAVVNGGPPSWSVLSSMAHEKAHQRLIAREDEATFVGVIAMLEADEPILTYAAWQTIRRYLQSELVRVRPDALERVAGRLDSGPQRDVVALAEYWQRYEGWLAETQDGMNDLYLRANDVPDGTASYGRAVHLFEAWLRTSEGRRALGRVRSPAPQPPAE